MKQEIADKLLEYLQKTEDFALEQIPDVMLQALKYEKIAAFTSVGLMLFLFAIFASISAYLIIYPQLDQYGSRQIQYVFGPFLACFAALMTFIQLCISIDKLIMMFVSPKYYVLILIKSLM